MRLVPGPSGEWKRVRVGVLPVTFTAASWVPRTVPSSRHNKDLVDTCKTPAHTPLDNREECVRCVESLMACREACGSVDVGSSGSCTDGVPLSPQDTADHTDVVPCQWGPLGVKCSLSRAHSPEVLSNPKFSRGSQASLLVHVYFYYFILKKYIFY